ncbi:hypothetical protein AOA61_15685 [Pseudomonas sp. 2995-1]|nr:hypothetical protein AOA61_15685 [Pseudomonas sp. 2995-1]
MSAIARRTVSVLRFELRLRAVDAALIALKGGVVMRCSGVLSRQRGRIYRAEHGSILLSVEGDFALLSEVATNL